MIDTTAIVAGVIAIVAGGSLVFVLSRNKGRWLIAIVVMVIVLAFGLWFMLGGRSERVWVDALGAVEGKVEFSAPLASGHATGSSYFFTSRASSESVFEAFSAAYPEAVREGDTATLTVGGHVFTLTYFPRGMADLSDEPSYLLVNDQ